MYGQTLTPLQRRQGRELRRRSNRLATQIARIWRRSDTTNIDEMLRAAVPQIVTAIRAVQTVTVADALALTQPIMEQFDDTSYAPAYMADARAWAGWNGNGQPVGAMLMESRTHAVQALDMGLSLDVAKTRVRSNLVTIARTCVADTQRSASMVAAKACATQSLPIRVLNPPSCARCVILAGTSSGGFERHPNCDCTFIWAKDAPDEAYTSPDLYLETLSDDELARVLGSKANARAYKDGADLNQLVNAYRRKGSVRSAQWGDRRIKYTLEGTTRRGAASYRMIAAGYANDYIKMGGRYTRVDRPRLMPETIYESCARTGRDPRAMLAAYGWIL